MEHQELASRFRQSLDTVVEEYSSEYEEFYSRKTSRKSGQDFDSEGRISIISKFFGRHGTTILEMDSVEDTCDFALENFEPVRNYHSTDDGGWMSIDHILRRFISDVLSNTGRTFEYEESDFQTVYQRYESDLLSDTLPARWFVCLQGLQIGGELEEIELEENVVIRSMTDKDRSRVANSTSPEAILVNDPFEETAVKSALGPKLATSLKFGMKLKRKRIQQMKIEGTPPTHSKVEIGPFEMQSLLFDY